MLRITYATGVLLLLCACDHPAGIGSNGDFSALPGGQAVLLAAGDIAACHSEGNQDTAELLDELDGTVLALGDNAYQSGSAAEFSACYDPSWGRHRDRIMPVPGNHEYRTPGGAGYYAYFGAAAGPDGEGYYSFEAGPWHLVALNSEIDISADSPQLAWLAEDLAAHPATCTLAYLHRPRFSSGTHGSDPGLQAVWQVLYQAGADVVLAGHDHDYERFAPLAPDGTRDEAAGLREFVVGTGGSSLRSFAEPVDGSEVRIASTFGLLRLALNDSDYHWSFVGTDGRVLDSGSAACH